MKDLLQTLGNSLGGKNVSGTLQNTFGNVTENINSALPKLGGMNVGGMLGSAALGGLLGALFSGKGTQKLAKGALMVGGTAAAGALAWNFYQKWSQSQGAAQPATNTPMATQAPAPQQALPSAADNAALVLLEAIVFAARADGHIDEAEREHIDKTVKALFPQQEMSSLLETLLTKPIDPYALAARIQNAEEARDIYRLSCAVIDIDSFMEQSYLSGLATALGLSAEEKQRLEEEAQQAKQTPAP